MSGLVLVAAGGLAREVLAIEHELGRLGPIVLVDDDPATWGRELLGHPVVGGLDAVSDLVDHQVLVCAGRGSARRRIVERLVAEGVRPERFARTIDPSVRVPAGCAVGSGSILLAGAVLTADVHVGDHVVVMPHATLTHDVVVGDFATLCAGVSLGGRVQVGSGAYVGMNAAVREGLSVGADATLGMGAVLLQPLPAHETWAGVPARPVRRLAVEVGESA